MKQRILFCIMTILMVAFVCGCNNVSDNTSVSDGNDESSYYQSQSESDAQSAEQSSVAESSASHSAGNSSEEPSPSVEEPDPVVAAAETKHGSLTKNGGVMTSTAVNTLGVFKDSSFSLGTYSATIVKNGTGDDGIVFGLSDNGFKFYWETGVSYYFYFVSQSGHAYLGKVENGSWASCAVKEISGYTENGEYSLKVVRWSESILQCYVNDELYFTYYDQKPLKGSVAGVRSGVDGVRWKDIKIVVKDELEYTAPNGFGVLKGRFISSGDVITSVDDESVMICDEKLEKGTVSAKIRPCVSSENGIVFCFGGDEKVASYYKFTVTADNKARLIKNDGSAVTVCGEKSVSSVLYSVGNECDMKAVVNGSEITCYIGRVVYVSFSDDDVLTGRGAGVTLSCASTVRQFALSDDTEVNVEDVDLRILFIGNSHTMFNDMSTKIFGGFVEASGKTVDVKTVLCGGHTMSQYADPADAYGAQVIDMFESFKFDYVVLQENSDMFVNDTYYPAEFDRAMTTLFGLINENGAKAVFYSSYGNRLAENVIDVEKTVRLAEQYTEAAEKYGASVAYAGFGFMEVYSDQTNKINLHYTDNHHPSVYGSYLVAAAIYQTIYLNEDVRLIDFNHTITSTDATKLKEAAYKVVKDPSPYFIKLEEKDYKITMGSWEVYEKNGVTYYKALAKPSILMFKDKSFKGGSISFDVKFVSNDAANSVATGIIFGATAINDVTTYSGTYYVSGRYVNEYNDALGGLLSFRKLNGSFDFELDGWNKGNLDDVNKTYNIKIVWDKDSSSVDYYIDGVYQSSCVE